VPEVDVDDELELELDDVESILELDNEVANELVILVDVANELELEVEIACVLELDAEVADELEVEVDVVDLVPRYTAPTAATSITTITNTIKSLPIAFLLFSPLTTFWRVSLKNL
jgi:hypothetical protein